MRLTYVGHSTVLLELDGVRVLTDPLLRGRFLHVERRVPPVDLDSVKDVDLVLISHAHHDHLDRPSLRMLGRRPAAIVPRGARSLVDGLGLGPVEELEAGDELHRRGLQITGTHADHRPGRLLHRGPAPIGFMLGGTSRVYFAGDTDLFGGMRDLGSAGVDVALLPVWGWGPQIGRGHLDPRKAAEALSMLRPRVAIPIHWGTFYPLGLRRFRPHLLTEPPLAFAREAARTAAGVEVRVLAPGESTTIGPSSEPDDAALRRSN
jgi:L-ascorbate metabolism protein UlaG (beta-lactamase superfamily)